MTTSTLSMDSKLTERSFINVGDLKLAYVEAGHGDPLVLIPGLGRGADMWKQQIDVLAEHFKVYALENRGSGKSDAPAGPYTVKQMAADAAAFIDALELDKPMVMGASMGGFIAQELAANYRDKVSRLILVCTSHGGPTAVTMSPETWKSMSAPKGITPKAKLLSAVRLAFSPEYFEKNLPAIIKDVEGRLQNMPTPAAWMAQAAAGATFDMTRRLDKITCPTLIITGLQDIVVPAVNSRLIHRGIEGSRLIEYTGGGHYIMVEERDQFNQDIIEFLKGGE